MSERKTRQERGIESALEARKVGKHLSRDLKEVREPLLGQECSRQRGPRVQSP